MQAVKSAVLSLGLPTISASHGAMGDIRYWDSGNCQVNELLSKRLSAANLRNIR
jgi:hypothetical protein